MRVEQFSLTGWCETPYFRGTVLPGGCDVRRHCADGSVKVRAEYTLEGLDQSGKRCTICIVNQQGETDWKPVVTTDSTELAWMNDADLTAVVEDGGLTIRIYGDKVRA